MALPDPVEPVRKPNGLTCEVCGNPLTGKQRRACSAKCRNALRTSASADVAARVREVAQNTAVEAVQDEMKEQVGKVVQEALTDEITAQLKGFVHLIPNALAAIEKNLASEDDDVRQKAATTLLRYTLGNPSVAPPSITPEAEPLQIQFMIPRSDSVGPAPGGGIRPLAAGAEPGHVHQHAIDVESTDLDDIQTCEQRVCMECGLPKCADEFVGQSPRCLDCHRRLQERVEHEFGHVDLG